jgi:hypothetical protein
LGVERVEIRGYRFPESVRLIRLANITTLAWANKKAPEDGGILRGFDVATTGAMTDVARRGLLEGNRSPDLTLGI